MLPPWSPNSALSSPRGTAMPLLILTLAINPAVEEMFETGYFVRSLQRYGMWSAVSASALFRTFLHVHLGVKDIVVVFPVGLIFGLFIGGGVSYGR